MLLNHKNQLAESTSLRGSNSANFAITSIMAETANDIKNDNYLLEQEDTKFEIVTVNKKDILSSLNVKTDEDLDTFDSIISSLEQDIAEDVRNMKAAQIPMIGVIRINPVSKEFIEYKSNLKGIRKNLTQEQYREHIKSLMYDLKVKKEANDKHKLLFVKIRRNNKKKYEKLCRSLGRHYAELFIMSIYWLKEVPFDAEWEEHYQELKRKE